LECVEWEEYAEFVFVQCHGIERQILLGGLGY
jgi:hypothetical protein